MYVDRATQSRASARLFLVDRLRWAFAVAAQAHVPDNLFIPQHAASYPPGRDCFFGSGEVGAPARQDSFAQVYPLP